jgi:hypothetical protein
MSQVSINSGRYTNHLLESDSANQHPLISWRSIVAGLLISFMVMATLLSLGMALGGNGLSDGATAKNAGLFTGIWFVASAVISLLGGSYFAARISKFHMNRLGAAQGLVIASLFFGFFLYQTFSAIGWAGQTATSALGGAASAVSSVASSAATNGAESPLVRDLASRLTGGLNLNVEPATAARVLATRLGQGDVEGSKDYLASVSGISRAEASTKIDELRVQMDQAMVQARGTTAKALQATGWSLFVTMLLGAVAAVGGGALGSLANLKKPLTREQAETAGHYEVATV